MKDNEEYNRMQSIVKMAVKYAKRKCWGDFRNEIKSNNNFFVRK